MSYTDPTTSISVRSTMSWPEKIKSVRNRSSFMYEKLRRQAMREEEEARKRKESEERKLAEI